MSGTGFVDELQGKIAAAEDRVRKLKAERAPRDDLEAAVQELKQVREQWEVEKLRERGKGGQGGKGDFYGGAAKVGAGVVIEASAEAAPGRAEEALSGRIVRTVSGRREFNTRDATSEVSYEDQVPGLAL